MVPEWIVWDDGGAMVRGYEKISLKLDFVL